MALLPLALNDSRGEVTSTAGGMFYNFMADW